jgi:hypothetical protein
MLDSGISLYVRTSRGLFAVVLFTRKRFDVDAALAFTREVFRAEAIEHASF